jgi:hypothetical protein
MAREEDIPNLNQQSAMDGRARPHQLKQNGNFFSFSPCGSSRSARRWGLHRFFKRAFALENQ